jgi:hypothetical protein
VGGQPVEKELAVGETLMRTSEERPGWCWSDIVLQPAETPLGPDSPVRSIRIEYPEPDWWTSHAGWFNWWPMCYCGWWVTYCIAMVAASMVFALCLRPLFKVNL